MSHETKGLTEKQLKALTFIKDSVAKNGMAPTLRELCAYMGYSAVGSAQDIVLALRKKGFLEKPDKQSARSLILSSKFAVQKDDLEELADENSFIIRCLGSVPAGNPLEAIEERIGTIRMAISSFSRPHPDPAKLFGLKAAGNSMIDAGIHDGDWLVVQSQNEANSGEIVVARYGDGSTVKRLMKSKNGWYLKAENPQFKDIYASEDQPFEIIGKVLALQRTF